MQQSVEWLGYSVTDYFWKTQELREGGREGGRIVTENQVASGKEWPYNLSGFKTTRRANDSR